MDASLLLILSIPLRYRTNQSGICAESFQYITALHGPREEILIRHNGSVKIQLLLIGHLVIDPIIHDRCALLRSGSRAVLGEIFRPQFQVICEDWIATLDFVQVKL